MQNDRHLIPPLNVIEDRDSVKFVFAVPGADSGNLNVEIDGNVLMVEGRVAEPESSANYLHQELPGGHYKRVTTLPPGLKEERAQAELKNGRLQVSFSKLEPQETEPKTEENFPVKKL